MSGGGGAGSGVAGANADSGAGAGGEVGAGAGIRMVYVLLDGVGDLPHPDLDGRTPLQAARTPNLDRLARAGAMGRVVSVGRGIAPESDIAVFNMLGYGFRHADYAGRGVIEAIGIGIDFRDGDLALRGNFATLDAGGVITDRRAGRRIDRADAEAAAAEIERGVRFSRPGASVAVAPTIGHRVTVRIRLEGEDLSSNITNTDPAYARVDGMGIAKAVGDYMRIEKCLPLDGSPAAALAASLVNEFTEQSTAILAASGTNRARADAGRKTLGCILLRDAGSRHPVVDPISDVHSMSFSCIVDMPVEIGISRVLRMRAFEAGGLADYEAKARAAAGALAEHNAVYVHLKGPDEFGHDGDAAGKTASIEEIDSRFFGPLLGALDLSEAAVVVSADHSTPCISKGHSDDPVPLLVSGGGRVRPDGTKRFTEDEAKTGSMGLLDGADVVREAVARIRGA